MVSVTDVGLMIGPLIARELAKERTRTEEKFQARRLAQAVQKLREEIQHIDGEGLMARVALEKRVNIGLRALMERFEALEVRYAQLEMEAQEEREEEANLGTIEGKGTTPTTANPLLEQQRGSTSLGAGTGRGLGSFRDSAAGGLEVRSPLGGEGVGGGAPAAAAAVERSLKRGCKEEDERDEVEDDMIRRLEEKMSALEGKLKGHEERQMYSRNKHSKAKKIEKIEKQALVVGGEGSKPGMGRADIQSEGVAPMVG
ncbi:unnamed protein product [Discosporangium mesarthrocarpum]